MKAEYSLFRIEVDLINVFLIIYIVKYNFKSAFQCNLLSI